MPHYPVLPVPNSRDPDRLTTLEWRGWAREMRKATQIVGWSGDWWELMAVSPAVREGWDEGTYMAGMERAVRAHPKAWMRCPLAFCDPAGRVYGARGVVAALHAVPVHVSGELLPELLRGWCMTYSTRPRGAFKSPLNDLAPWEEYGDSLIRGFPRPLPRGVTDALRATRWGSTKAERAAILTEKALLQTLVDLLDVESKADVFDVLDAWRAHHSWTRGPHPAP